ncbi:MAG TPA: 3-hydroxyacyl-CoA dehydrogenase NAD-binding domain-containing protein [Chthoniobacterales bacterium]|nr:3-hydroxyacyl-CoA dehydrogenase NAD-binding domain-containing protein [Chthoniobacterales bacterium]
MRSPLGISSNLANMSRMTATAAGPMIRREIGDDGICILTFDRPESGANIFDAATMEDLRGHVDAIEKEAALKGVIVVSAKKSIFIAGADLKTLLKQAQTGEMRGFIAEGQKVFNRLAALKVPTVAAIHGACAGGGYEITLACDYRIASDDPATKIGLPETTLGLVPAWGGATRLPRLIGTANAAEVILKGKLYGAAEALKFGLVDEVVAKEQLLEAARKKLAAGKRKLEGGAPATPASQELSPPKIKGNAAPGRAYEIIKRAGDSSVEESLAMEVDAISELGATEATQNLIRNFFLADKYRKGSSKTPAEKIQHAAVIGAGVMGSGIAQWLSSRGVSVILRDVDSAAIDRGLANIDKTYADAVKRGLMKDAKAKEGRARIVASTQPGQMRDVQIVIEAASEKLEIKKKIFTDLAANTPETAILATNTSALPIDELATSTGAPARVVGLHFFNPVSRMKLIEVVVGRQTSDEVRERALAFARQIGKLPVLVQDSPGFLVNRVLFPYLLDAAEMFENGVSAEEIDGALLEWGMPMGPLRLIDEIGVDITVDIAATLEKAFGPRDKAANILQKMYSEKILGRKTGAGFYKYEGKQQTPNESLEQWRQESGEKFGLENLTNRLVYLMVNEAARCLEEKVVATPADADYGMVLGTGFPIFRGGPLRYAESVGLKKVVTDMDGIHSRAGEKFAPCDLLRQHAQDGTTFYGGR